MNLFQTLILIVSVLLILVVSWLGRYTIIGSDHSAYQLDRWTGTVVYIVRDTSYKITMGKKINFYVEAPSAPAPYPPFR